MYPLKEVFVPFILLFITCFQLFLLFLSRARWYRSGLLITKCSKCAGESAIPL